MATNSDRGSAAAPEPACSSAQAQAALAGLDTDRVRLAERVITPWWYHPVLGGILAAIVASYALLPLGYSLLVVAPGLVAMVLLATIYSRRYGVAVTSVLGPRTRRLQIAVGATAGVSIASSLILSLTEVSKGWTLIPMAVVFSGIIVIGRRYDEALRSEMADGAGERR